MHNQELIARSAVLQATAARLQLEARKLRQDAWARRARWPDLRRLCLARGASDAAAPPLILVVEDNADVREMFAMYFVAHGFRVLQAADGLSALYLAREHMPAVVLMDLGVPCIDGWEITRRLKATAETHEVAILALSGYGMPDEVQRAREAGADVFLRKPVAPAHVLEHIRALLSQPALHAR